MLLIVLFQLQNIRVYLEYVSGIIFSYFRDIDLLGLVDVPSSEKWIQAKILSY